MISTAPLRAALRAAPGDDIVVGKGQLEQLLAAVDNGQAAQRELRMLTAIAGSAGTERVSAAAG